MIISYEEEEDGGDGIDTNARTNTNSNAITNTNINTLIKFYLQDKFNSIKIEPKLVPERL